MNGFMAKVNVFRAGYKGQMMRERPKAERKQNNQTKRWEN